MSDQPTLLNLREAEKGKPGMRAPENNVVYRGDNTNNNNIKKRMGTRAAPVLPPLTATPLGFPASAHLSPQAVPPNRVASLREHMHDNTVIPPKQQGQQQKNKKKQEETRGNREESLFTLCTRRIACTVLGIGDRKQQQQNDGQSGMSANSSGSNENHDNNNNNNNSKGHKGERQQQQQRSVSSNEKGCNESISSSNSSSVSSKNTESKRARKKQKETTQKVQERDGNEKRDSNPSPNKNHAPRRRRHGRRRGQLLNFEEVPEWLQFNPFVRTGYRPPMSIMEAFWSVFSWHNETLNIWSHLLPMIFVIFLMVCPPESPSTLFALSDQRLKQQDLFDSASGLGQGNGKFSLLLSPFYFLVSLFHFIVTLPLRTFRWCLNPFAALTALASLTAAELFQIVLYGFIFVFSGSCAYHTFMPCCSTRLQYQNLLNCDVMGVSGAIVTSTLSYIWRSSGGVAGAGGYPLHCGAASAPTNPAASRLLNDGSGGTSMSSHGGAAVDTNRILSSHAAPSGGAITAPDGVFGFIAFIFYPLFGGGSVGSAKESLTSGEGYYSSSSRHATAMDMDALSSSNSKSGTLGGRKGSAGRAGYLLSGRGGSMRYSSSYSASFASYVEILSLTLCLVAIVGTSAVVVFIIMTRPHMNAKERAKLVGLQIGLQLIVFFLIVWPRAKNDGFDTAVNYHTLSFVFIVAGGLVNSLRFPERFLGPSLMKNNISNINNNKVGGKDTNSTMEKKELYGSEFKPSPWFLSLLSITGGLHSEVNAHRNLTSHEEEKEGKASHKTTSKRVGWRVYFWYILSHLFTFPELGSLLNSHTLWHFLSNLSCLSSLLGAFYDGIEQNVIHC